MFPDVKLLHLSWFNIGIILDQTKPLNFQIIVHTNNDYTKPRE